MMKRLLPLFLLLLAGCRDSSSDMPRTPDRIRILPLMTRVTGTDFDRDDRIGLTLTVSGVPYATNREMIYDGTTFSSEGFVWYNDATQPSDLTAYYPYAPEGAPDRFTVPADQSAEGFAQADLLSARRRDVLPGSAPVEMLFDHLFSKIRLTVENRSDGEIDGVSLEGSIPTADVDLTNGTAEAAADVSAEILIPHRTDENTWELIAVPQTVAWVLHISTDDGKVHTHELESTSLRGGKIYTISVTVTNIDLSCQLSGDINDWTTGGAIEELPAESNASTLNYGGEDYRIASLPDGSLWLAENLRVNPGTEEELATGAAGALYPSGTLADAASVERYGLLYDGETAQGICPPGWRLPAEEDFETLQQLAAEDAESFLTLTPALWQPTGGYKSLTDMSYLWSAIEDGEGYRKAVAAQYLHPGVDLYLERKHTGIFLPVRCRKE